MNILRAFFIAICCIATFPNLFANKIAEVTLNEATQNSKELLVSQGYTILETDTANLYFGEAQLKEINFEEGREYVVVALYSDDVKNINLDAVAKSDGYIVETTFTKKENGAAIAFRNDAKEDLDLMITNRRSKKKDVSYQINYIVAYK